MGWPGRRMAGHGKGRKLRDGRKENRQIRDCTRDETNLGDGTARKRTKRRRKREYD